MVYGTLPVVRDILNLDDDDVEWNDRITRCLGEAEDEIDNELAKWGATVPLTTVPGLITDAANYLAAGFVNKITTNPTAQNPQVTEGPGFPQGMGFMMREDRFVLMGRSKLREYVNRTYNTHYATKSYSSISPAPP